MIAYRICKARYGKAAFSGAGAMETSGRWHRKGNLVVYAASTLSLAALEYFVHLGRIESRIALVEVQAAVADGVRIETLDPQSLPKDWSSSPPVDATMDLGTRWLLELRSAVLKVPSAIVRGEFNFLLNPRHPDFKRIRIAPPAPFSFDPRMWK